MFLCILHNFHCFLRGAIVKEINIQVRDKIASLVDKEQFIVGGNNDYTVKFDFDEEWGNEVVKTALFVFDDKTVYSVFEGDTVKGEAIEKSEMCAIGCFAGELKTTTPAFIKCVQSIRDVGGVPNPPSQDVYDQIMDLLNRYINSAKGAPSGGKAGQVLKKKSDLDYDYQWENDEKGDLSNFYTKEQVNEIADGKLPKQNKVSSVYANDSKGTPTNITYANYLLANSIMARDGNGNSKIADAVADEDIVNLRTAKKLINAVPWAEQKEF